MPTYYVDGQFVPASEAVIPVDDLAIMRGFGVFDLLRTLKGRPLFLKEHIRRLEDSGRRIGIQLPWSHQELIDIVLDTLHRNSFQESNIRIVVTGGSSPDFITPQGKPRLLVLVTRAPVLPEAWYTDGVRIITFFSERSIPGAKSIDYVAATIALKQAKGQGAIEAVYVDHRGRVLEGTTSNIFALINGKLVTPGTGILSGVTRKAVLDLAAKTLPVDIRDLRLDELTSADEVFITGTNKMIVPVVQVDRSPIGDGRPGRVTQTLMRALSKQIDEHYQKQNK
ncbi:MAG: aminotransferase class IV [Deltaproteobacteria bacterium]|nr:aminotransferase class IV [Deltaproteobacteria bacterium]